MTSVKIAGKPYAAASGSLEEQADWLWNHPGGRLLGVVEFAHTERSEPAPQVDKDRTVTLAISGLELATLEQEETLRKAIRALFIQRTATGTLDPDGEVELSQTWLNETSQDLSLRESTRLRAGVRHWADQARKVFLTNNLSVSELMHELDAIATGLSILARGVKE